MTSPTPTISEELNSWGDYRDAAVYQAAEKEENSQRQADKAASTKRKTEYNYTTLTAIKDRYSEMAVSQWSSKILLSSTP